MNKLVAQRIIQPSFAELGTPLFDTHFCVVDLETTGIAKESEITEIGAVMVRDKTLLSEFQTLVRPQHPIPAPIQSLTGITNSMVANAPTVDIAVSSFLHWAGTAVFVAHNANFDVGFLKRACRNNGISWPNPLVIDTVALARRTLSRTEVANYKLSTLAGFFNVATAPNHRAHSDAKATAEILNRLLQRVKNLGITTIEELTEFLRQLSPDRQFKQVWAKDAPCQPGVYWFSSGQNMLYVGKSTNLRRRITNYFTAAEQRRRIHEMIQIADQVSYHVCATALEAAVRELRIIAAQQPKYNQRSRRQDKVLWLKFSTESFPRLLIVNQLNRQDQPYFGPFNTRQSAEQALELIHDVWPVRQCQKQLTIQLPTTSCVLAELARCEKPCETLDITKYNHLIMKVLNSWQYDLRPLIETAICRITQLVTAQRFEQADTLVTRLRSYISTAKRGHRIRSLASCPQIIAASPTANHWIVHIIRYGRLVAASTTKQGEHPITVAKQLLVNAETVLKPDSGLPAATVEETELIASWLETPGIRLIEVTGEWAWPIYGYIPESKLTARLLSSLSPTYLGDQCFLIGR